MTRTTGTYAISTTLGESVRAFVPYALPPAAPALSSSMFADRNRRAELALARLCGLLGLVPSVDWLLYSAIRKEAIGGYSMVREARGSSLVNCAARKIGSAEHELATPYLCRRHQSTWPNCWPTWSGSFTIQRRICLPW